MKNLIKCTLALLITVVISSCAAMRVPDMTKISIGMSKAEVQTALRKNPDNIVGAKKYPNGQIEVQQYLTSIAVDGRREYTWLFFFNNKLIQFGYPEGEWQYTADNIAAMEARKK